MDGYDRSQGTYDTPRRLVSGSAQLSPTLHFYTVFLGIVFRSANLAKRGRYEHVAWTRSSQATLRALESAGLRVSVTGLDHLEALQTPCVFAANHMSMMETVLLPGFIRPFLPVTFVIKESLTRYPLFKHVMLARKPIVVTRTDPRADLQAVLEQGKDCIERGLSVIIFPQTTRTVDFERKRFNSIAVKLARRASVPVVPIALRTDGWTYSKGALKDLGRILPERTAHFAFGEPIPVTGRGTEAHEKTLDFIESHLTAWGLPPSA